MSVWNPTHVQFTVLRARHLIAKGKGGNNDVFVTIQLGKEKYQTSTIKNALHPEWFEECDLPIPNLQSVIEVSLYHKGVLSDDFLGYAAIALWSRKVTDTPKSEWITLQSKPNSKSSDPNKARGQLEVKLTFHCHNRSDVTSAHHGLKKKSSSIRNIAAAFGDKFRRSRSFRENRRDPEGGKPDRGKERPLSSDQIATGHESPYPVYSHLATTNSPYRSLPFLHHHHHHHNYNHNNHPSVHFAALDVNRSPLGDDANSMEGLTRSYSLSAAYIKSMSLDRRTPPNYSLTTGSPRNGTDRLVHHNGNAVFISMDSNKAGVSHQHSQSMSNLPGDRRSCSELPLPPHPPPPPYDPRRASKDDTALTLPHRRERRTMSDFHLNASSNPTLPFRPPPPPPPTYSSAFFDHSLNLNRRERSGIYESIKEKTEPENSASNSSSSDLESVPRPKQRSGGKRFTRREVPVMGSSGRDYGKEGPSYAVPSSRHTPSSGTPDHSVFNARDSGILDDRSSSHGNSLEGSMNAATDTAIGTTAAAFNRLNHQPFSGSDLGVGSRGQEVNKVEKSLLSGGGNSAFLFHLDRDSNLTGSGRVRQGVPSSQFYCKENSQGELVVRKRSRGERDRLRMLRQGSRRYTVQGLEHQHPMSGGLLCAEGSLSETSDSSIRQEVPDDILSVYKGMTKEELLRVVLQTKAQMIRKDQYIKDLENYIDGLLVRVMETTPRLLNNPPTRWPRI